ncbi:hypothetical protein [Ruegeria sp.]|uniref:hypothetical protein n=1 Tax=Ruegeria sp. TaxID=1879320 RepID=UPI003C7B9466
MNISGLYIGLALLMLSSCTKIPDASTKYYLTKSSLRLDVSRAVNCSAGNQVEVANAVNPVIVNSADFDSPRSLNLTELRATFTDPNVAIVFYDDGRLKSINTVQTGTAGQIVKAALTLASATLLKSNPADFVAPAAAPVGGDDKEEGPKVSIPCAYIKKHGNKAGILTLQYSAPVVVPMAGKITLEPVGATKVHQDFLNQHLESKLGDVVVRPSKDHIKNLEPPVIENDSETKQKQLDTLKARQLTRVAVVVKEEVQSSTGTPKSTALWNAELLLALHTKEINPGFPNEYGIPLPSRPAFGKQEFQVAFSDSGALTNLKYASESGTSDAIGTINTTVATVAGPSAADQAKALQAEADLIKQRERLAACRADPSNCQ